jgi:IPT/TIG domain
MRSRTPDPLRMQDGVGSRKPMLGLALLVLALFVPVAAAQASTLTVTGMGDAGGTCNVGSCPSLRSAVERANGDGGNDTIQIPAGGYQLTSGKLAITASMTLAGAGATSTKILAAPSSQIIAISGSGKVTLADMKLEGAKVFQEGAAVRGSGSASITIQRAIISHNESKGGLDGGGVYDSSTAPLLIESSTLSNNTAKGGGAVDGTAPITVINSTLTENTAENDGGAFEVSRTTLINDTITGNKCGNGSGCGGGVNAIKLSETLEGGFAISARDTILAGNIDGEGALNNCLALNGSVEATIGATGPNLENGTDCKFKSRGGLEGNPLLSPLGDNGGPTPTMLPASGSPAINTGENCAAQDQRGHARPTPAGPCDIGAVELGTEAPAPTVTSIAPSSGTTAGGVTVTIRGSGFLPGATVTIGSAATALSVVSETEITATTPAHAAGATEVVVTDAHGTSTGGPSYTYLAPGGAPAPFVTSIAPSSGTTAGGVTVMIRGSGFLPGATVTIGSAATSVGVVSETEITAVTPAYAAGATEVVVSDANGTSTGGPTYVYLAPTPTPTPTPAPGSPSSPLTPGVTALPVTPVLSQLLIAPARFGVASSPAGLTPSGPHPRGTRIDFALSEAATVRIAVRRVLRGHRHGGQCLTASARGHQRQGLPCTRSVLVGTLSLAGAKGANAAAFGGRLGARALVPGNYVAIVTAEVPGASASAPLRAAFTVVR